MGPSWELSLLGVEDIKADFIKIKSTQNIRYISPLTELSNAIYYRQKINQLTVHKVTEEIADILHFGSTEPEFQSAQHSQLNLD